jgi:glucose-1-phosphate thymidylyltransferase
LGSSPRRSTERSSEDEPRRGLITTKALILSGGKGTRLRPITHTSAKQLVPIANKPILFYGIEAIRDAGISDIGIVVGDTAPEIQAAVGDGSKFGARVTYIRQEAPLGLAHAVSIARDFIGGERFVMYLGDNLIIDGIKDFVRGFEASTCNCQILLAHVPNPQDFGVAELAGDRVVRLVEKPSEPKTDLALVGVYLFDETVFAAVGAIKPSRRNELEITDAIQHLIDSGRAVKSEIITGWWKDTGKLEDILEANRMVLGRLESRVDGEVDRASRVDGKVILSKGSSVVNSVLRGPLTIGENSRIVDSYVGPFTSIYYNVEMRGSEIEHSIVLENSRIIDVRGRIESSLVGKNVQIERHSQPPKAYRFMVGDYSRIERE